MNRNSFSRTNFVVRHLFNIHGPRILGDLYWIDQAKWNAMTLPSIRVPYEPSHEVAVALARVTSPIVRKVARAMLQRITFMAIYAEPLHS